MGGTTPTYKLSLGPFAIAANNSHICGLSPTSTILSGMSSAKSRFFLVFFRHPQKNVRESEEKLDFMGFTWI
jgi:hypothetical protein